MQESKSVPTASTTVPTKEDCPETDEQKQEFATVPYKSAVGSLWYAANGTRPDITYAVNVVSQFSTNPGNVHWQAVKRILRFLNGNKNFGITYTKEDGVRIVAYSDSDWAGDVDGRRSRTGYVVYISGGAVAWMSKSQKVVALSSCEAELYALCECMKEILWLLSFLDEMSIKYCVPVIWVDNQGAIALSQNPVHHQRTKHIDVKWYFIRDVIKSDRVLVRYVQTQFNIADIFTKATVTEIYLRLVKELVTRICATETAMLARTKNTTSTVRRVLFPEFQSRLRSWSTIHSPPLVVPCTRRSCRLYHAWSEETECWEDTCTAGHHRSDGFGELSIKCSECGRSAEMFCKTTTSIDLRCPDCSSINGFSSTDNETECSSEEDVGPRRSARLASLR